MRGQSPERVIDLGYTKVRLVVAELMSDFWRVHGLIMTYQPRTHKPARERLPAILQGLKFKGHRKGNVHVESRVCA